LILRSHGREKEDGLSSTRGQGDTCSTRAEDGGKGAS
jgi:hypothetical protein